MGNEMAIKDNLIKARSHIIFLVGLISAFGLVIGLESYQPNLHKSNMQKIEKTRKIQLAPAVMLTDHEKAWGNTAWQYFENNYQPETGMVNSVDNYPASTMWDTSSYLMALISARKLDIISNEKFDERVSKVLTSLAKLELFEGELPNKSYNTKTLEMVDYANNKSIRGIGWSAIDVGRLLVPLNILVWQYPQHTYEVKRVTSKWRFNMLIKEGVMYGTAIDKEGKTVYVQEGRLGYEQYAAKSLELLGLDVSNAVNYMHFLKYVDIYNIAVPIDSRDPDIFKAHNYVVSEPYILEGLEYGWGLTSDEFAYRVFAAQEQRYLITGVLTAVSEDNLDQAPYFVYNTVYTDGKEWQTITVDGTDASKFRSISTKAVIGWHVLYNNDYTKKLMSSVEKLNDPKKGWYSGLYEVNGKPNKSITANTNAIILESLCYKRFGPMLRQ
jgi:hypothetical protein